MEPIRMVDLHTQYFRIKQEIDEAMQGVSDSTAFIRGYAVKDFQTDLEAYLDDAHVITCANGTDALQIALMALDLKPGDEVITSTFTFIATVEVIAFMGLKPVMVDVDPDTFLMRPADIQAAITSRTKAIIPVHLFGQCCDMERILSIAKAHQLYVIEDAAQSLGAGCLLPGGRKLQAGTIGDIGTTSFFPSKNLGCFGDGGAIMTRNQDLARTMMSITNHGMQQKYYYERVGVNSRLDTLQAAILQVKLKYLDAYSRSRQKAADYYDEHLSGIPGLRIPKRVAYSTHIFHQYTIQLTAEGLRDDMKKYLQNKGIPSMIYYPLPLHLQKAYEFLGYKKGDLPVSEDLSHKVLSLPMHTEMDREQLEYITTAIQEYFKT